MVYIYKDRPIQLRWEITKSNSREVEDFTRAKVWLFVLGNNKRFALNVHCHEGKLVADIPAKMLVEGTYSFEALWVKNWNRFGEHHHGHADFHVHDLFDPDTLPHHPHAHHHDFHHHHPNNPLYNVSDLNKSRIDNAFGITEYEEEDNTGSTETAVLKPKSCVASYGYDGLDAYQLAIVSGRFFGSEDEWFESLHGRDGNDFDGEIDYDAIHDKINIDIDKIKNTLLAITQNELNDALKDAKKYLEDAKKELEDAKKELEDARKLLESLDGDEGDKGLIESLAKLQLFADWYDTNAETITNLSLTIDAISDTITLQGHKIDTLNETVGDVKTILDASDASITDLASWIDAANNSVTELKQRIAAAEGTISTLGYYADKNGVVRKISEVLDAINAKIETVVTEAETNTNDVKQVRELLDAHVGVYETKVSQLESGKVSTSQFKQLVDKVSIVVSNDNTPNAAQIIAAINNDRSSVKLSADKVEIDGDTFIKFLEAYEGGIGQGEFKGDYFFSKYGVDSAGKDTTSYEEFNPDDPYGYTASFKPNWCVNLKTGDMWASGGKINFKTDGSGQIGGGDITIGEGGGIDMKLPYYNSGVKRTDITIGEVLKYGYHEDRIIIRSKGADGNDEWNFSTDGMRTLTQFNLADRFGAKNEGGIMGICVDFEPTSDAWLFLAYKNKKYTIYRTEDIVTFTPVYTADIVNTEDTNADNNAKLSFIFNIGGKIVSVLELGVKEDSIYNTHKNTVVSTDNGNTFSVAATDIDINIPLSGVNKSGNVIYVGDINYNQGWFTFDGVNFKTGPKYALSNWGDGHFTGTYTNFNSLVDKDGVIYITRVLRWYNSSESQWDERSWVYSSEDGGNTWVQAKLQGAKNSEDFGLVGNIHYVDGMLAAHTGLDSGTHWGVISINGSYWIPVKKNNFVNYHSLKLSFPTKTNGIIWQKGTEWMQIKKNYRYSLNEYIFSTIPSTFNILDICY